MEINWIIILDYSYGGVTKIKLTDEERNAAYEYEDFEEFMVTLEDKYGFQLSDCNWMTVENLSEITYVDGKEITCRTGAVQV